MLRPTNLLPHFGHVHSSCCRGTNGVSRSVGEVAGRRAGHFGAGARWFPWTLDCPAIAALCPTSLGQTKLVQHLDVGGGLAIDRIRVDQGVGGIGGSLAPVGPNSFEGDARFQMRFKCSWT